MAFIKKSKCIYTTHFSAKAIRSTLYKNIIIKAKCKPNGTKYDIQIRVKDSHARPLVTFRADALRFDTNCSISSRDNHIYDSQSFLRDFYSFYATYIWPLPRSQVPWHAVHTGTLEFTFLGHLFFSQSLHSTCA